MAGVLAFGAFCAVLVTVVAWAVLLTVRSDAERDVDSMLLQSVQTQMNDSAAQLADVVQQQLAPAQKAAETLAAATLHAYEHPVAASAAEVARYADGPNGSYSTTAVDGGASMIYTGFHPVGPAEKAKAAQLAAIDPTMTAIVNANPLIVQAYVNTWDSMNRIYPGFDVQATYPARMDIASYNFFYQADAAHNPERGPVWTNVYIDPAGQGWMISAVAPVYFGGRLEAVVGVDVTVARLIGSLLAQPQPFGAASVLLDGDDVIMAMPRSAEDLFHLREVTTANYSTFVTQDTFKPDQFDLRKRPDSRQLAALVDSSARGGGTSTLDDAGVLASWHQVENGTNWKVMTLVSSASVQALHAPGERLKAAAAATLWVLAAAFLAFGIVLAVRFRSLANAFTGPLEAIDEATARIAAGDYTPDLPPASVAEMQRTSDHLLTMGRSLQAAHDRLQTEAEESRQLIDAARTTADSTSRLKDEFLASMSHEIRTPLNGVIGVLSLLADDDLPEDARRQLAVARASADDLLVLVNDVLDFAKIEAGQVSVVVEDARLSDVMFGIRHLYEPFAHEQRDRLEVEIHPALPAWVRLDRIRVRQALANLVSNALKFTEGGLVTMRAVPETPVTEPGAGTFLLRFEVVDTGRGVEPEVRDKLFTRFTQGDPLAARKHPGTGLGLAITKRLAELIGGSVGLESDVGRGSTFWFTVECEPGEPLPEPPVPALRATHERMQALRVLVAEDNDVNRYLMVSILERLGHHVVAVVNGREAVETAQRDHFDLILMDVQMPVANGIDATRAIRALPGRPGAVPILAVTANVLPDQQVVYRQVGFTGWVPKPLTLEQVERAIVEVVPQVPGTVHHAASTPSEQFEGAEQVEPAEHVEPAEPVPAVAAIASEPMFDGALIDQYREVLGPQGATQMVDLFVQTLGERSEELRAAVAAGDLAEVRRIGHTIKGMAAAIGAVDLSASGLALQHAIEADVPELHARFGEEAAAALRGVHAAWKLSPL
jgi:signal transduction histidine kinase/HPt (histidine-containing phosphotransfer) domain-containing protein/ActR/RegA family two-component response regulator